MSSDKNKFISVVKNVWKAATPTGLTTDVQARKPNFLLFMVYTNKCATSVKVC